MQCFSIRECSIEAAQLLEKATNGVAPCAFGCITENVWIETSALQYWNSSCIVSQSPAACAAGFRELRERDLPRSEYGTKATPVLRIANCSVLRIYASQIPRNSVGGIVMGQVVPSHDDSP